MFGFSKKMAQRFDMFEADLFFERHTTSHIQLEFFVHFPSGKGHILEEIQKIVITALSSGSRIKMCLRLRLQPTEVGKSLVKGWIASKQLEDRKKELIHQMNTGDRKTLYREYRQVTAQVSKMVRTLRTDVMKYLLLANVSDVAVEDVESYFHPVLHQETLLQIKDILKNNNHPIMSFLCESPELCAENQEVLGCVFIF